MKMRTQKTLTFLFLLSFLFAQVSESTFPFSVLDDLVKTGKSFLKKPSFLSKLPKRADGDVNYNKLTEDVEKLKDYAELIDHIDKALQNLQSYGFLNSSLLQPNSPHISTLTYLQSVVRKIQANFNLKVTGELTPNTANILSKPRCDFPDKINGTNTYTKVMKKQILLRQWWGNEKKKTNLTYAFGKNVPAEVKVLFQNEFTLWSNAGALKFTETKVIKDSDFLIAFVKVDGKGVVGSWKCIFP